MIQIIGRVIVNTVANTKKKKIIQIAFFFLLEKVKIGKFTEI